MKTEVTRLTKKGQTTVPLSYRKVLGVKPGENIEWYVAKAMVVVDKPVKINNPAKFLVAQTKLDLDAVELVKKAREGFR